MKISAGVNGLHTVGHSQGAELVERIYRLSRPIA